MRIINLNLINHFFLFFVASSWLFFPFMIKPLALEATLSLFAFSILLFMLSVPFNYSINKYKISFSFFLFFIFYLIYLIGLFLSSLHSHSSIALNSFSIAITKVIFLFTLLRFINYKLIIKINDLYSNVIVFVSFFSVISFIYIEFGLPPLHTFELYTVPTDVYFFAYHTYGATPIFNIAGRLQGLAEEGGTFAMALLPALFWEFFVRKKKFYILVILLALLLTMSLGAFIYLLIIFLCFLKKMKSKLLGLTIIFLMTIPYIFSIDADSPTTVTWEGKLVSFNHRLEGVTAAFKYLSENFYGAGSSLGMLAVNNAIAVGYINASVDAGLLSGLSYCLAFSILIFLAVKKLKSLSICKEDDKSSIELAISCSLLSILFMGFQRMQPDQSYWHMSFIAFFLFIRFNKNSRI